MQTVPALPFGNVPVRKARSDTELRQFLVADEAELLRSAGVWVQKTAPAALREILAAGNPKLYVVGVDGETSASGNRVTRAFHAGTIESAKTSVRVEWIGTPLAAIANVIAPVLREVILEIFPYSATRKLARGWSWYVQRGRFAGGSPTTTAEKLGTRVPNDVGIYDVLWFAPDAPGAPASYAWIANTLVLSSGAGHALNMTAGRGRQGGRVKYRLKKKLNGYLAEATKRARGKKIPGVSIQGWFVKKKLTGPQAVSKYGVNWKYGVPVIRVAYKQGLTGVVSV